MNKVLYDMHTVGKRKNAIARVYMLSGTGKITVNRRPLNDYFVKETARYIVNQPLVLLNVAEKYDILVNVKGGGITGQANAIRLGIARGLDKLNPEAHLELKKAGFLTRDARIVERKKSGMAGARKRYQFSKR